MWQYTLDRINPQDPDVWYSKKHFGKNPLSTFMPDLSKKAELSQIYTNHSIRSTGITVLTNDNFSRMPTSWLCQGIKVCKVLQFTRKLIKKKMEMGKALCGSMLKYQENNQFITAPPQKLALPSAPSTMEVAIQKTQSAVTPKENVNDNIIPFQPDFKENDDIADFDLLHAICDIEEKEKIAEVPVTNTVANTSNVFNQVPKSFFADCQIGTIDVNIVQK